MANIFDYLDNEDERNKSISVIAPTAGNSSSGGNIFDFLDELPDTTTPTTQREPLISMDNLRSSHASTNEPIEQEPNYKAAFIKGTLSSLPGRALTPLVERITGKEVDLSTLPEQNTLGEKAVSFGSNMVSDLPLWVSGDALLAKPLAALSKTEPVAKAASLLPKAITPALGTGIRAGSTYALPINAAETMVDRDGVDGFAGRLKEAPIMALGGSLLHGGGQLAGKGINGARNILADRRLGQLAQPLDEAVQNAFRKPLLETKAEPLQLSPKELAYKNRQAELNETFKDLPIGSVDTPATRKTLQQGIDDSVGIGKPTEGYGGLEAFGKPLNTFRRNTDSQDAVAEISAKMEKQVQDIAKSMKQADGQTRIESIRNQVKARGGIKQGNPDIFEEQKVIPNWIRNDKTGRPLDEVADELGMSSDELLTSISDSSYKPKDYVTEAYRVAYSDPEYQALSNTLDSLKGGIPGKRTIDSIPKLKPRELTPQPEQPPIQQPKRLALSGSLPEQVSPAARILEAPSKSIRTNESLIKDRIPFQGLSEVRPVSSEMPKVGYFAPIGEPIKPLAGGSDATAIESPSSVMRIKGPDTVKDFPQGDIPAGLKERGVSENIRTDANRPDALRDSYSADPLVYKQLGNKETLAKAQSIFDKGLEPAISELDTLIKDLKPEAAPLVKMLADKLTNEGNIVRARELMANAANRATESGQFGQAFRILRDADPETLLATFDKMLNKLNKEGLDTYGKKWDKVDLTPDELTMVGNIERGNQASYDSAFEQIQARIADEMPATAMEKINAWRHISMLLNVKSNVRNIGGNAIMMGMRKAAQRTSGVIQKVFLKESDRTQSILVDKAYKDLAKEYVEINGKEILGGANKFQEGISLNMPDKRVFRKSRIGEAFGKDIDILDKTRKFNYALLQKGDTPFFRKAYEDRIASYAQAKKIKDFSELPQEAFDIAKKEAMEATYKDSSIIADFLNKAKRPDKDAGIARKAGAVLTEAVIPFAKTPLNVLKRGLQFSPIGVANGLGSIKSSKGAAAAIDELAKGLTGTGVLGLGYLLASKGVLTGKVSKDADMRAYDSSTGHSPFSVMGKYSFDWAAPLSIPLSVGVEIYNAVKDNPEDKAKMDSVVQGNNLDKLGKLAANASEAILDGMNASGDVVFNMSVFRGVKLLLGGQQGVMEGFSQLPQSYATQFIPTTLSQTAGSVDPLVRQTYVKGDIPQSFKNALKSRIPLASTKLPPKQTPFGEDVKKIENPIGRAFSQFLSPGIITKDQDIDPKIDTELRRLNDVEGLKTQFPTMVPNYIEKTQTHPRITLTPEETIRYQKRVGELTLNSFQKVMGKGSYIGARGTKLQSPDEVRAKLLADAIAESKALAKKEILKSKGLK